MTSYTYDNMNRPLSKATGNLSTAYTYDTLGNVLTMTDGTGVTTYDYTGDGLLTGITTPDNESISYTHNSAGYLVFRKSELNHKQGRNPPLFLCSEKE